jgi:hypothetical protein
MGVVGSLAPAMAPPSTIMTKVAVDQEDGNLFIHVEFKEQTGSRTNGNPNFDKKDMDAATAWEIITHYIKQPFEDLFDNNLPMRIWFTVLAAGILLGVVLPIGYLKKPKGKGVDSDLANRLRFRRICSVIIVFVFGALGFAVYVLKSGIESQGGAMLLLPGIFLIGGYVGCGFLYLILARVKKRQRKPEGRSSGRRNAPKEDVCAINCIAGGGLGWFHFDPNCHRA